jgi:diphosphomevalonate decarboxylase
MPTYTATAVACANIALIKYWGNRDVSLRIPTTGSISMNLKGLLTRTRVIFDSRLPQDIVTLNGTLVEGESFKRVSHFLDLVRARAGQIIFARVESGNNFPIGIGLASSAAGFAALSLAASQALGLNLPQQELSRLARHGSGSACRSIPSGFVEWIAGTRDEDSYAISIAPPEHWDLTDCIAIVETLPKKISSTAGHALGNSSPLQDARILDAPRRLKICRRAIQERDFSSLTSIVEHDSNLMHAVMMTSIPPLFYWEPSSLTIMKNIPLWRKDGVPVCYTLDAGPNIHLICPSEAAAEVTTRLKKSKGVVDVLISTPGSGANLIGGDLFPNPKDQKIL